MKTSPKTPPSNVTFLSSKVAGRFLALTSESCDGLARQQSETVWGSQISSLKLSSDSSRNAKLRPISKGELSSFRRSLKGGCATNRRFKFEKRRHLFIGTY